MATGEYRSSGIGTATQAHTRADSHPRLHVSRLVAWNGDARVRLTLTPQQRWNIISYIYSLPVRGWSFPARGQSTAFRETPRRL